MAEQNSSLMRVSDLKKTYDEIHAVDGISFTVPRASVFTILGPNGTAKEALRAEEE